MTVEDLPALEVELGGESACYAHLLCRECGAVLDEHHRQSDGECEQRVNDSLIGDGTLGQESSN